MMILVKKNIFYLNTNETSYIFRVADTGHLEHLHYGTRGIGRNLGIQFSEDAAVSIYSVMYLFDIELSKIIKIIEGIRYNRSSEYILGIIVSMG